MKYEKEILLILREADPQMGLPLSSIVRNVFNITSCDIFSPRPYKDVYSDVQKDLYSEVALRGSYVERAEKRGYYRLNRNSQKTQQMLLQFEVAEEDEWMM